MIRKPVIFISATSDLRSARELVAKVLYSLGYEPVWQDIEATDGGELLGVLQQRIERCDMMVQLVGHRYGAEPIRPTAEFGRVSYTQFEALEAERLHKKVIYHFLGDAFPADAASAESAELASLQAAYHQRVKNENRLRYSGIANATELELSIHKIRDELAAVRQQADRRFRNLRRLTAISAIGIVLIAALVFITLRRQAKTQTVIDAKTTELNNKLEAIAEQLRPLTDPKPMARGQNQETYSPQVLEKASFLVKFGDAEQQALGFMFSRRYAEADRIIKDLQSRPGNTVDEQFRFLTLEGNNWWQADQPDKAIEPYDRALNLKPNDIKAQSSLAVALTEARLDNNAAADKTRAIKMLNILLSRLDPHSVAWARTQISLGAAWASIPIGRKIENLKTAANAYNAAMTVFTKENHPYDWALAQIDLAMIYRDEISAGQLTNFKLAIGAFEKALSVLTLQDNPFLWASAKQGLGATWCNIPDEHQAANVMKGSSYLNEASKVFTKQAYPSEWASLQVDIAMAWLQLPAGNKADNISKGIAALNNALTVYTREAYPTNWALTKDDLGNALSDIPSVGQAKVANLKHALASYDDALTVFTQDKDPYRWAEVQANRADALSDMPGADKAANLQEAMDGYKRALTVFTKDADPFQWANTKLRIGYAWDDFPGDKAANLLHAIDCYEAALTVFTQEDDPRKWAIAQKHLGISWMLLPTGDRAENLTKAVNAYGQALKVFTKMSDPTTWALIKQNIAYALVNLPVSDPRDNLLKAIDEENDALSVFTKESSPIDWAKIHLSLGGIWSSMPTDNRRQTLANAIAECKAALSIPGDLLPSDVRVAGEATLASCQLALGDFNGALATAANSDPGQVNLTFQLLRAHALLLSGRKDDAMVIYLKHVGENVNGKLWEQAVFTDFDNMESQGITCPQMPEVRQELQKRSK